MARFPRTTPTRARRLACAGALALAMGLGASSVSTTVSGAATKHHVAILVATKKNATLGAYLVTAKGFTLYTFTLDTATRSACTGGCTTEWPPVLVPKGAKLSSLVRGVKPTKLGKLNRGHGKFQLTYLGKPLYRFAGDKSPGQRGGQGIGNVWFVAQVTPKVVVVATPTTATPPTTAPATSHSTAKSSSTPTSPPPTSPPPTSPPATSPPPTSPPPTTPPPTTPPVVPGGGGGGGGYGY